MRLEWQVGLLILVVVVTGYILQQLGSVVMPFAAAIVLAYLLNPLAEGLQNLRIKGQGLNRLGAVSVILLAFICLLVLLLVTLLPVLGHQLAGFLETLPATATKLQVLVTATTLKLIEDYGGDWMQKLGLGEPVNYATIQKSIGDFAAQGAQWLVGFVRSLVTGGAALASIASLVVLTPVITFYVLLDWNKMIASIDSLVPPRHSKTVRTLAREMDGVLAGFLRGQSIVCLFLGLWYGIGMTIIGLNFGFLIGLSAGILSFIPYVGSMTALVLSCSVALVQDWPSLALMLKAVAVVAVGQFLEGNILSPRLVGESVGLHPVWLMFALLAAGSLFGFVGLLVAVPFAAALAVLLRFALRQYRASPLWLGGQTGAAVSRNKAR